MNLSMATEGKKGISLEESQLASLTVGQRKLQRVFPGALEVYEGVCVFPCKIKLMFSFTKGPNLHSETCPHTSAYCLPPPSHPFNTKLTVSACLRQWGRSCSGWRRRWAPARPTRGSVRATLVPQPQRVVSTPCLM